MAGQITSNNTQKVRNRKKTPLSESDYVSSSLSFPFFLSFSFLFFLSLGRRRLFFWSSCLSSPPSCLDKFLCQAHKRRACGKNYPLLLYRFVVTDSIIFLSPFNYPTLTSPPSPPLPSPPLFSVLFIPPRVSFPSLAIASFAHCGLPTILCKPTISIPFLSLHNRIGCKQGRINHCGRVGVGNYPASKKHCAGRSEEGVADSNPRVPRIPKPGTIDWQWSRGSAN